MEKAYNKAIHHISTLILRNEYSRALSILNYLNEQGLSNSEMLVMQSYCIKHLKGTNAAINHLQFCDSNGPLIQMSLAQYLKQLNENSKCFQALTEIQKPDHSEQKNHNLQQIIKSVQISMHPQKKPPFYTIKHGQIDIEGVNLINSIVQKYKKKEEILQVTFKSLKQLKQNRKIEGKLSEIVQKFIVYLEHQIRQTST